MTANAKTHVLVVDDDPASREGMEALLTSWGYRASVATNGAEAVERLAALAPHVVISDLVMPKLDGLELLATIKREAPGTSVILLTGQGTIETAVQAMKDGAYDYLEKPVDPGRLEVLLERAAEQADVARELRVLRRELRQRGALGPIVAGAPSMREVTRQVEQVAPTDATVLVLGESGTGKELVARTVHELSPRARGPFVALNCAAIPDTLLESEVFGHEKGAFTGAAARRQGCFELADGGTLFLDEVAEMAPPVQVKFLRVLQEGRFRRVGGTTEVTVDVRVVAATNQDPQRAVKDGGLREDLYYRLNVFTIALPPLRERLDDLDELVRTFLVELNERHHRTARGLDDAARAALMAYSWPGNVRELRNVLERAIIVCDQEVIRLEHLPSPPRGPAGQRAATTTPEAAAGGGELVLPIGTTVDEAERQLILRTLAETGQNKTRAAQVLGISLKTLHNKLHRYRG
jgi:DNA-binding NtrC family response regulator